MSLQDKPAPEQNPQTNDDKSVAEKIGDDGPKVAQGPAIKPPLNIADISKPEADLAITAEGKNEINSAAKIVQNSELESKVDLNTPNKGDPANTNTPCELNTGVKEELKGQEPATAISSDTETGSSASDDFNAEDFVRQANEQPQLPDGGLAGDLPPLEKTPAAPNKPQPAQEGLSSNNVSLIVGEMLDIDETPRVNGTTTSAKKPVDVDQPTKSSSDVSTTLNKVISAFTPKQDATKTPDATNISANGSSVDSTSKDAPPSDHEEEVENITGG